MDCMEEKSIFNLKKEEEKEMYPNVIWGRTISFKKLILNTSKMMYSWTNKDNILKANVKIWSNDKKHVILYLYIFS